VVDITPDTAAGFSVVIEPHPARRKNPATGELDQCIFDQQQVMVCGRRVAWCGAEAGKPISFIARFEPAFVAAVLAEVTAQLGGQVSTVGQPPKPEAVRRGRKRSPAKRKRRASQSGDD
jgi:hypothetical protein